MKINRTLFLILIFSLESVANYANKDIKDFKFLVEVIKNNYPGYDIKTNGDKLEKLKGLESEINEKIVDNSDSTLYYMREYLSFFQDRHISVRPTKKAGRKKINELDKIEVIKGDSISNSGMFGIWFSPFGDILVKKYLGKTVVVSLSTKKNKKGAIIGTIETLNGKFVFNNFSEYSVNPTRYKLHMAIKDQVLEIDKFRYYIRRSKIKSIDLAFWCAYKPDYPQGSMTFPVSYILTDSTFFLRIPSFSYNFRIEIEKTIEEHWHNIMSRPNLIIDIRNNGGGLDISFQPLSKLIYTDPYMSLGVEWYATKEHIIEYSESIKKGEYRGGESGKKWMVNLVEAMKKNIGGYVIHPDMGKDITVSYDTVYNNPKNVGIIINQENASSAEQFILNSKHSSKVTLFGNKNTAGVLDYSNTTGFKLPSGNYLLLYPMTRSRRLPDNPIDNIGIKPDIIIPLDENLNVYDKVDSWVDFVRYYYEYR